MKTLENNWVKLILFSTMMVAYKIGRNDGNRDGKNVSIDLSKQR